MADSGTVPFSVVDGTVKIEGNVHWAKSGNNAVFYAKLTHSYSSASSNKFVGNGQEHMRLAVDGTWSENAGSSGPLVAGARTAGASAGSSGWITNDDYGTPSTASVTKAAKDTAYELKVEAYGNGTKVETYSVTILFALPIWADDGGTLKQIEKAYYNDNGTIRECAVYYNDDGTIKEIK